LENNGTNPLLTFTLTQTYQSNMQTSSKFNQADSHLAKPKQSIVQIYTVLITNVSTGYEIKIQEEVARSPSV